MWVSVKPPQYLGFRLKAQPDLFTLHSLLRVFQHLDLRVVLGQFPAQI
jgi:hypothetical protein